MAEEEIKTAGGASVLRNSPGVASRDLHGRRVIYSGASLIDAKNVVKEVEKAYVTHLINRNEISYLWGYYKGIQPVLDRKKDVRPEINNRVVENRAAEIVDFKVGYSYGEPIQYVSMSSDEKLSGHVKELNDLMDIQNRASLDAECAKWQMICGVGYKLGLPGLDSESPFEVCVPDPRDTFVIYGNDVRHHPLAGVCYTTDPDTSEVTFGVYTADRYFAVRAGAIVDSTPLFLDCIPLVEYPLNHERIGAFEVVIGLLDAINNVDSDRLNGVEQFIQSLAIAVNCQFKEGTTANEIRQAGMIVLKSVGENKADFKILSEELSQQGTQTLKDDLYNAVRMICGMPSQGNASTSDSSNNGAVILRNGWQAAESRAKDYEMYFRRSEMQFLKVILAYCYGLGWSITRRDVLIKFTRRQYEDIYTKAQVLNILLGNNLVHPKVAYTVSNMFSDVEEAYRMGVEWQKEQEKKALAQKPTVVVQDDNQPKGGEQK